MASKKEYLTYEQMCQRFPQAAHRWRELLIRYAIDEGEKFYVRNGKLFNFPAIPDAVLQVWRDGPEGDFWEEPSDEDYGDEDDTEEEPD